MSTRGDGSNCRMCGTFFCKAGKSVSLWLAMFAAVAVNSVALAANATLSFNASGGTKSTSQFTLGSQALTFDRTTIPSWITGLTLHQNIGGMINNTIGLTPATGSWNTSGSSSTCSLDVTVAENTGAARSWTMNILNQSNGSVAWSMLVQQSAGSGGGTPSTYYTVTFNPNGGSVGESTRSVASGSSIGSLPTPSRSGYSFNGWWTAASGGEQIYSSTTISANTACYAHWTQGSEIEIDGSAWQYCVIDISGGSAAIDYPVSFLDSIPPSGWTDSYKTTKIVLRRIDSGSFMMGGAYSVTLSKPFLIGIFEITQKQYELVMGGKPSNFYTGADTYPAVYLSWNMIRGDSSIYNWPTIVDLDSSSFIGKIRARTGLPLDLPTEAQWEYACRAGTMSDYNNGGSSESDLSQLGNWNSIGISWGKHNEQAVGSYLPNAWGLYDMHGNAAEWCLDWQGDLNSGIDPKGPSSGTRRIWRGGSFYDSAQNCTSGCRRDKEPENSAGFETYGDNGFRLATANIPNICDVAFNANGGEVSDKIVHILEGGDVKDLPKAVRQGYAFDGWWTEPDGGVRVTASTVVNADVTFYAHWTPGFKVTFDANGGTITETIRIVQQNGAVGALPYPSRSGYRFDGWFTAVNGGSLVTAKTLVSGDVAYYAHWVESPYAWTYTGDTESGLTITGVSPRPSGFVEIPAVLNGIPVRTLGDSLFDGNSVVETIVVPDGVFTVGTGDKNDCQWAYTFQMPIGGGSLRDVYLPPTMVNVPFQFTFRYFNKATLHMTVGSMGFNCNEYSFANFFGALDIIALGGVPDGMVKPGLYSGSFPTGNFKTCTYRCKRAYKADWDQYLEGIGATFLGYIDDDYEYLDPILTINNGVLEDVQLMGGRDVVIPGGVTGIGANAFAANTLLRSVTMPASVKAIASGAFTGCTGLESIAIPYSLDATIATVFPNGLGNVEIVFTGDDMTTGGDAEWEFDRSTVHGGIVSRRSGAIGNGQESWIEMETQNPGRLSFWWKASSESDGDCVFDYAYLSIDDEPLGKLLTDNEEYQLEGVAIGGKTDWQQVVLNVTGEGAHTIRWTYCKDEVDEGDTGEDCVWLDDVVFTPLVSVTYDLGGGTGTAPASFAEMAGTVVTLPGQNGFDRMDYVFNGWSDGTTLYLAGASYSTPSGDVTLTAQWIKKTFLAFDLGGGTGTAPEVVKELRGTVVALPVQSGFDRADYVFDGWSDGTATYAAGANFTMPSEDVTLTAQWIEKRFLTFMIDGGEGTVPVTIKDIPGAVVTLPTAEGFSKPKHTFVGWSNGTDTFGAGDSYTVGDGGVEFAAVWQRNETYVVIESSGVVDGGTVDTQGATISMAAWSDPSGGTPAIYYTLDASVPTTNSTRYVAPFVADGLGEVTVKAIAVMDNYFDSDVATFTFTRLPYSAAECIGVPAASVTSGGDMPWFRVLGDPAHDGAAAMRSGAIGDSQSSYVEMTVRGSGSVSFWWKVSSQNKVRTNKHDYLSFTIDGIETATLGGGDIDWTNETCSVADNGMHTLRWTYLKDAADAANEDCAWLDDVAWTPDNNDPLPEIGSSAEVALVLAGSTDSRLVAHIATKADYDGFRTWVDEKGLNHKTVMDSRRAWFSYAIGANGLIDRVFGNEDVNIVSIVPMAGGVLTFDAAVAGAPVGAGASPERLASVFAVEGADTLSEEAFSTNSVDVTFAAGLDGRLAVSATPKVSGDAFFMKLKVYPDSDAGNTGGTDVTDPVVASSTVTFNPNGGTVEEATRVVSTGSAVGSLPVPVRNGFTFDGWFTAANGGTQISASTVVSASVVYYAHWTEISGAGNSTAGLIHRWSFNGNLTDSVGGQTATLGGSVTTDGSSFITQYGSSGSSYISLGSDVLPREAEGATFEMWVTRTEANYNSEWLRIFEIGDVPDGFSFQGPIYDDNYVKQETTNGVGICWACDTGRARAKAKDWDVINFPASVTDTEYHIAVTYKHTGSTWEVSYYCLNTAGTVIGRYDITLSDSEWSLASVGRGMCVLGQALTTWDLHESAKYNEFRVWSRALTQEELVANDLSGPDNI